MEAISKIHNLARGVMWRKRLLALQDSLALGLLIGGLISAALIFYIRWKAIQTPVWVVALVVFSAALAALLTRWSISRASENDAGFLIDDALKLEDRVATSQALIGKSRIENEVEKALLEDASSRIEGVKTSSIVPYRMKKSYALTALSLIAFTTAVMIPQQSLPGGEEIIQTQADIQAAGEQLEKSSTEIEKFVPPETVTAGLAKEQAELGRSLRRSSDTRAEALKKLSSLEDRIRERHDELKSTRADEIVALAQKRMGAALSQMAKRNVQPSASETEQASSNEAVNNSSAPDSKRNDKKLSSATAEDRDMQSKAASNRSANASEKNRQTEKSNAGKSETAKVNQNPANKEENRPQKEAAAIQNPAEQKNGGEKSGQNQIAENQKSDGEKNPNTQKPNSTEAQNAKQNSNQQSDVKKDSSAENPDVGKEPGATKQEQKNTIQAEGKNQEPEQAENKEEEQNKDASNPLTTAVAEQTAKALPALSEQLLKKAEDLKLGKMSAEDIKKLAQSATQLAKDLAPIAQSKEFQKTLEQLAKQVNPQQLEQIARELMKDEKLQRELKAAAKLLWENRQVKDMVAGLTKTAAEIEADMRQQSGENRDQQSSETLSNPQSEPITLNSKASNSGQQRGPAGQSSVQKGSPGQGSQTTRMEGERRLAGQGREAKISGQLQNRPGGDYVYSGVKPGAGAARVPYSSAYPQYRRQAERTVERSQVPTHMRSMIRSYFDAINPNGKK